MPKALRARELGVSRGSLYYQLKQPGKDWQLKCRIEEVLRRKPSYGHRRIAGDLKMNKKPIIRVMNLFGIKPCRRRGKRLKSKKIQHTCPNMLMTTSPLFANHIWVSDFTRIAWKKRVVYVATVMDIFTRKIVGLSIYTNHAVQLVLSAFLSAIHHHCRPMIFHSDNGSEFDSGVFIQALETLGVQISRSAPGCPWENGYQESFYSQFKVDLGDPNQFDSLGELVFAIYQTIRDYNHSRIHSALGMPPVQFAKEIAEAYNSRNKVSV